jgi:hypothetical protein
MMGTCKGCGTENVELNEQGLCANCAAKQGGEMGGDMAGTEGGSEGAAM